MNLELRGDVRFEVVSVPRVVFLSVRDLPSSLKAAGHALSPRDASKHYSSSLQRSHWETPVDSLKSRIFGAPVTYQRRA
jgi:hypothetical protein